MTATPTAPETAIPTATATVTPRIDDEPGLRDFIERIEAGPQWTGELVEITAGLCSFHGELYPYCAERGLGVTDTFDSLVVSDLLHCEGCERPIEQVIAGITALYRDGGVDLARLWDNAPSGMTGATPPPGAVAFARAWRLDLETVEAISERWPELTPAHAVAFTTSHPPETGRAMTGFLLVVDLEDERPVAIMEVMTESWSAADLARYVGGWTPIAP